jgi:succinoglycan biosynthesis protein ExoW
MKIAVIIPFFQRESGLLQRAVDSALTQIELEDAKLTIVVVDDGSPLAAAKELSAIPRTQTAQVRVLEQKNRGPASARNLGLDRIDADTDYVAFLDSDDFWMPQHLRNAIMAMRCGADFYFSNLKYLHEDIAHFDRAGFPQPSDLRPPPSGCIASRFVGDFGRTVIVGCVTTPTVVYRFSKFPHNRFPETFQRMGEDQFMWAQIGAAADFIAVSTDCEVIAGKGVSIYSDQTFGTTKSTLRLLDEIRYRHAALRSLQLSEANKELHRSRLDNAYRSLAGELLHHAARGRAILCLRAFFEEPSIIWHMPTTVLTAIRHKLLSLLRRFNALEL